MDIILTIAATGVFIFLWPVLSSIWDYNARWAIALWVLTLDAVLWYGVYLSHAP